MKYIGELIFMIGLEIFLFSFYRVMEINTIASSFSLKTSDDVELYYSNIENEKSFIIIGVTLMSLAILILINKYKK